VCLDRIVDRYLLSSKRFGDLLAEMPAERWAWPTPCTEWTVRQLVNHMARGNLNYARLAVGGPAADFVRLRDADALGTDPVAAYADSVHECAAAFTASDALDRPLDYPLGTIPGRQALAIRTVDATVHTWDLATAIGADTRLDPDLVTWIDTCAGEIYAGLGDLRSFFAPASGTPPTDPQARLLWRMGR
jgi:uncharacterized protein (TIGR03086 family)